MTRGDLVEAYYHAMCGGKILDPNNIWEGEFYGFKKKSVNIVISIKKMVSKMFFKKINC